MNVGFRIEDAFMARAVGDETGGISGNEAYLATFDYYFNSGKSIFAPFVGAGAGYYSIASVSVGNNDAGAAAEGKFGGLVRAGFEAGKFRLALAYNLPSTKIEGIGGSDLSVRNSYFSVTLGFYIGGGSWKK
jgi:hypothetical protein